MQFNIKRYDNMLYRRCGNSGLLLPVISLGLWHNFGDNDSFCEAKQMIFSAFDSGITHFDLANNYGSPAGSAETNFGKIFNKELKAYRDEIIISTKAGYTMWEGPYGDWGSRKYLISSLNQSLKRMNVDYVDIFYSHRFDPYTPLEETMGALSDIVKQGKALYVGISNYDPQQTIKAVEILNSFKTPCLIHQVKYSMFNKTIEESGLLDILKNKGIGCIVFSPLAQGLLTDKYLKGIPKNSRASKNVFLKETDIDADILKKINALNDIAKKRQQTLAQMAIAWILRHATITSVLIGASSVKQLNDNIDSIKNLTFNEEYLKAIDNILTK